MLSFQFKKSKKIAPGIKLNFSKRGVGATVGGRGLRMNTSSRGVSIGSSIPGTGISYNKKIGSRSKRPQRTRYEQARKEADKQEKIEQAKLEVEQYEAHVEMLTSVHEETNDPIYWNDIAESDPPFHYEEDGPNVQFQKQAVDTYKPTLRDRIFNRSEPRKQILIDGIEDAREEDKKLYEQWEQDQKQANDILKRDMKVWNEVLTNASPFEDIQSLGSKVKVNLDPQNDTAYAEIQIRNSEVVPVKVLSLTKTGKLSQKNMAKGEYFQLYQDYVCSCAIRVARELFSLYPLKEALLNVYDESTAEENTEYGCILSVKFTASEMNQTHFENIDCSDTIETFQHNMKFLKTKGFKLVKEVE